MEKLDFVGYTPSSVKCIGITNQRETTLCWDKTTGKALCRAIVWDDARTVALVRELQRKLDEEGLDPDEREGEDDLSKTVESRSEGASRVVQGITESIKNGLGLGGKDAMAEPITNRTSGAINGETRRRKGKDALIDVTGLPLSTYFSAVKLRWMVDHHEEVKKAYDEDRLAVGTVDSWLCYVSGAIAESGTQNEAYPFELISLRISLAVSTVESTLWTQPTLPEPSSCPFKPCNGIHLSSTFSGSKNPFFLKSFPLLKFMVKSLRVLWKVSPSLE